MKVTERAWAKKIAIALAAGGLVAFGAMTTASANLIDTFNVSPNPITAGGQATLDLQMNLSADGGDYNAFFVDGTVTLYDGLGTRKRSVLEVGGPLGTSAIILRIRMLGIIHLVTQ